MHKRISFNRNISIFHKIEIFSFDYSSKTKDSDVVHLIFLIIIYLVLFVFKRKPSISSPLIISTSSDFLQYIITIACDGYSQTTAVLMTLILVCDFV